MIVTRRAMLAGGVAGLALAGMPAGAAMQVRPGAVFVRSPGKRDYAAAIAAIRAYAEAELAATGLPGMTMSLVADDGFSAVLCLGWADLAARTPVRPDHLFEIGSISKSLVALTLWSLAQDGRIDLNAPAARYLPATLLPPEPITTQQILNHVAGLPNFAPSIPQAPGDRLWTGAKAGTRFYYSNTGYDLAGLLIDAVSGRPHALEIAQRTLRPLGMRDAAAIITSADRPRLAQGYAPQRDDLSPLTGAALVEGPWNEMDIAAGSVIATPDDMAAYLRFVIALGRGAGAPLLDETRARALLKTSVGAPEFGDKARYASGFATIPSDGRTLRHHTGGMLQFASAFDVDAEEGVGCFASVNGVLGSYRPIVTTAYAVRVLRTARAGKPLPDLPDPMAFRTIQKPERFVGRWVAADGRALEISAAGRGLTIGDGRASGRLEGGGGPRLMADLPGWDNGPLEFSSSKSEDGPLDRLWFRDVALGRDKATPPLPPLPDRLRPLPGRYRTNDQWVGGGDVVARGDRLALVGAGTLVEDKRGFWRVEEDVGGLERFRFDAIVGGRAQRLNFSGTDLWRIA